MSNVVSLRTSTEISNVARPQHEADPVTYLIDNMERVAPSNISFVSSLITQALGRKGLSDKQMFWVRKFASELANPPAPEAPAVKLESLKAINELFRKAGDHLKYPKVRLQITNDETTLLPMPGRHLRLPIFDIARASALPMSTCSPR